MPTPVPTTTTANSKVLVVGMISSEPVKLLKRAQPLADYLAAELGKFGVGAGEVKIAPDPSTMAGWTCVLSAMPVAWSFSARFRASSQERTRHTRK